MSSENHQNELLELLDENKRLLEENNYLLKKMHRSARLGLIFKIVWIIIFIIGPIYVLYNYLLPNLGSIQQGFNSYEEMNSNFGEIIDIYNSQKSPH